MILLVPVVLALVSRVSARLPLTLRYAARDAARHRTRTVPAVAAVAATVAGVVALGIATSSDEKQNEAGYTPTYAAGVGVATGSGDFTTYARLVQREIPGATVTPVRGVAPPEDGFNHVSLTVAGDPADDAALITGYGSSFGSDVLVSDGPLPAGLLGLDADGRRSAEDALAAGRIVAFTDTGSCRCAPSATTGGGWVPRSGRWCPSWSSRCRSRRLGRRRSCRRRWPTGSRSPSTRSVSR
jgi:putative ABC transport system permease protein